MKEKSQKKFINQKIQNDMRNLKIIYEKGFLIRPKSPPEKSTKEVLHHARVQYLSEEFLLGKLRDF